MIAIVDYGMGNLRSVEKVFESIGAQVKVTHNRDDISSAERIVLPGVGAIRPAVERLGQLDLVSSIKEAIGKGIPFLGICLGFQLLFEESDEGGSVQGLGILAGSVDKFPNSVKVPHMGWNQLKLKRQDCALFKGIDFPVSVYFCHSYYVNPTDECIVATSTEYACEFASSICMDNIFGVQFHPEKSQEEGLRILKNFMEL